MAEPGKVSVPIKFGPFELSPDSGELRKNGTRLKLTGQAVQVLITLLEKPGQIVTREELQQKLWPGSSFGDFEHGLNAAVNRLRDVLGDSATQPKFIETIPRRGYRFVGPVSGHDEVVQVPLPQDRRLSQVRLAVGLILAVFLIVVGVYFTWKINHPSHAPSFVKLLVLPIIDLSDGPQQEYFSDALTDEIISQLGSLQPEHLGVIARITAMHYKATKKTAREIGTELGVNYILESSVQRSANRVHITAQLISAQNETAIWSESYDRDLSDILMLRGDVAQAVANAVQIKLTRPQQLRLATTRSLNPQAYDFYLMGLYYAAKDQSGTSAEKKRQFFQKAIDADPTFAPAYAALANAYVDLCIFVNEACPKAKVAALKSIELDSDLPEGHANLGFVKFIYEWDWWGAEKEFRRATETLPTRLTGLRRYISFLMLTGRANEGLAFHRRMIEMDPLSTELRVAFGWTLKYAHRYDEGIRYLEQMLKDDPNLPDARYHLSWNYAMAGRYAEAVAECEKIHNTQPCAYAYARAGHRKQALKLARENEVGDPVFTAATYFVLGDREKAFQLLERGYREHLPTMVWIWAASELDPFRSDPHFQDIVRRMNFPPNPALSTVER
jgi:TolB-like protein/DNA-binding winged helix-turn-helix (wHTH) protein